MTWLEFWDKHPDGVWTLVVVAMLVIGSMVSDIAKAFRNRKP